MNNSLRKGNTEIYLQHANTGHNINAKFAESEVINDLAILRLTLSPTGDNQKHDEGYLHKELLQSADIHDGRIIEGFFRYVKNSPLKVSLYQLELLSKGKKLEFNVTPKLYKQGDLRTLHLAVNNS